MSPSRKQHMSSEKRTRKPWNYFSVSATQRPSHTTIVSMPTIMNSSQASKQPQQPHHHPRSSESRDRLFGLTANARFQAQQIEQPTLRDMLLHGNYVFSVTTEFPNYDSIPFQVNSTTGSDTPAAAVGGSGNLLNLMRVLDEALLISSEIHHHSDDQAPPCRNPKHILDQWRGGPMCRIKN